MKPSYRSGEKERVNKGQEKKNKIHEKKKENMLSSKKATKKKGKIEEKRKKTRSIPRKRPKISFFLVFMFSYFLVFFCKSPTLALNGRQEN